MQNYKVTFNRLIDIGLDFGSNHCDRSLRIKIKMASVIVIVDVNMATHNFSLALVSFQSIDIEIKLLASGL